VRMRGEVGVWRAARILHFEIDLLMPCYIGDFLEVGFTRAGTLPARPCHFHVRFRTDDARAGRSSLFEVSGSSCARRDVCALAGCAIVILLHSSLELVALRAGRIL
jgi:hypothetical protein